MNNPKREVRTRSKASVPSGYTAVLADLKRLIADSRHRALATVNRELVALYWQIGQIIVQQQETANWGDAVVEQLSADLRAAFPDMKGLTKDNLFRMRKFCLACGEIDDWLRAANTDDSDKPKVATARRQLTGKSVAIKKLGAAPPQLQNDDAIAAVRSNLSRTAGPRAVIVGAPPPQLQSAELNHVLRSLSWTRLTMIVGAVDSPAERYFYLAMAVRERWSVRELRRQIDSALFLRYMSVRRDPEKCLPADAEQGDLLPFKDHYVLEFLGLGEEYSEREFRTAILANLRDFFLEFGRDLCFLGDEYAITVGNDTFYLDLLFFHRRLQCLLTVDLKIGEFKPEYVGKSQFYCAALDEQVKLAHENPSIGLVLCKTADSAQVRLALTAAARKIGVATYQTALPDEKLIRQRLRQLPAPTEVPDD